MEETPSNKTNDSDQCQKGTHYDNRAYKLLRKNNKSKSNKNQKKIIRSFRKVGRCLNYSVSNQILTDNLQNVCLFLFNNKDSDKGDLKIGSMSDCCIFGLNHHRFGFKIFYLFNCESNKYLEFLQFFLKNSAKQLTIYYSGCDSIENGKHEIQFKDKSIECEEFSKIISENYNEKCKVVLISDCTTGSSVFGKQIFSNLTKKSKIVSFSIEKSEHCDLQSSVKLHGAFSYYFSKFLYECPDITPKRLVERMNPSLMHAGETCIYEISNNELENQSIFNF